MEKVILERFAYTPFGTFGRIIYGDFRAFTVERPWVNNTPRESCIPDGIYDMQWYNSPKFGQTWALLGETVSLFPESGKRRAAILIHAGNTMDDLLGCIALGATLGNVNGKWAVLNSGVTTRAFLAATKGKQLQLHITPVTGTAYTP